MIKLKEQKGITLVILSLAVVIMLIITTVLIYNATTGIDNQYLTNMYSDIAVLKDKISIYYVKNGRLPIVNVPYPNTEEIKGINENDNDNYYIIDLKLLDGLILNYGKGYDTVWTQNKCTNDIYVVNEQSHNVYYMLGIEFDNKVYYTIPEENAKINIPE